MAKNPIASMMAQAVTPGPVQSIGKKIPVPKGVQKTTSLGPSPGKPPPPPVKPGKGFGGKPAAKAFGKK